MPRRRPRVSRTMEDGALGARAIYERLRRDFLARKVHRLDHAPHSKLLLCGAPGWDRAEAALTFSRRVMLPLHPVNLHQLAGAGVGETGGLAAFLKAVGTEMDGAARVYYLEDLQRMVEREDEGCATGPVAGHLSATLSLFLSRMRPAGFVVAPLDVRPNIDVRPWMMFDTLLWHAGEP